MLQLQRLWEKELDTLSEIEIPDSLEWADQNVPQARKYIEDTHSEVLEAIRLKAERSFHVALEKYTKAWLRLWQRMAISHFEGRDIMDVDMRYYRHLPDGHSMTWDSSVLGKKFKVFPRKPRNPPKDMPWVTAGEMIRIHENPIILSVMKEFDGWVDRNGSVGLLEKVRQHEKKNPPEQRLKRHRKDKHGFDWYK